MESVERSKKKKRGVGSLPMWKNEAKSNRERQ